MNLLVLAGFLLAFQPLSLRAAEGPSQTVADNGSANFPGIVPPAPGGGAVPLTKSAPRIKTAWFRHGKRLTLRPYRIRRTLLQYIAGRVFPHPSSLSTKIALSQVLHRLSRTSFWAPNSILEAIQGRGGTVTPGGRPAEVVVTVDRRTLNQLAALLFKEVRAKTVPTEMKNIWNIRLVGGTRKNESFVENNLGVTPGEPLVDQPLGNNLYALSQLPGFSRVDALMVPLDTPGWYDLVVKTTPSSTLAGSQIEVDNYGYAAIGQVTANGTLDVNDTLLTGDQWTVDASGTPGGQVFFGMALGTLSYSAPLDLSNRLGIDMSALDYRIGGGWSPWGHGATAAQLVALGLSGSNYSFDGWESHAFVRRATANLALKGTLFLKEFQDTYSPTVQNDRSILGGTLDLSGSRSAGAWSVSFDVAGTEYDLTEGSGSSSANPFYTSTPGLQNFWTENGGVRYALSPIYAVYLSTVDQEYVGGGALDPMLQGVLGGMSNVRALPTATLFGNDLYAGSLAFLRTDAEKGGILVSSLFFDAGNVTGIGFSYGAMGPGVEESWTGAHLFARADLAVPVGPLPTAGTGSQIVALTGGNLGNGGIPLQLWLSAGWRY